jgi:type I restriction enzyme M protein
MHLLRSDALKEILAEKGVTHSLIFTASRPPFSTGLGSTALVLASWSPGVMSKKSTRVLAIDRSGGVESDFEVELDPSATWTVRSLDPSERQKFETWKTGLQTRQLSEIADVLRPGHRVTDERILYPAQITSSGIDFDVDSGREVDHPEKARPYIKLAAGDLVGRPLGDPQWSLITEEHIVGSLFADPHILAIRPTKIDPSTLLAFLHSDAASRQIETEGGHVPRIRPQSLRSLQVPNISGTVDGVSGVRRFRATSQDLANELETKYRTAFDTTDSQVIQEALADAATEASIALELVTRATDPLHRARQFYPHPLARTLRNYDNNRNNGEAKEIYGDLLRFGETAITVLGIVGLAYLTRVKGERPKLDWAGALRRSGISLGTWLDCANEAAEAARRAREPLGGLSSALSTKSPLNEALSDFLQARNDDSHGGGPRSPYEFERGRAELEERLRTCLDELVPLARSEWFVVASLRYSSADKMFRVIGRSLQGDHPDFSHWETRREEALDSDVVYVQLGSLLIPLQGFCQIRACPKCLNEELYYPDKLKGSMIRLRSLDRGHQAEVPIQQSELPDGFLDLTGAAESA